MRFLTAIGVFLLVVGAAKAQQDMGVITGLVTDPSRAVVAGAAVHAMNRESNEIRSAITLETGAYTVGPLRIGVYDISIEKAGFKKAIREGVALHAQDRTRADFELEVGPVTEQVSVTTEAPLLEVETSSLSRVVGRREIRALPLNGRNFQQLAWLAAGVIPAARSRDRDSGFNAHGQRMYQNTFIIDGVDNNNGAIGLQDRKAQAVIPSLDAVAEFRVQTSNYSAELGRNSGAVMNISIKSGTNEVHGTVFEYLRNDILDAREKFNYVDRNGDGKADAEVLRQNQFGATLGGAVRRNQTFYFLSWEGRRERRGQTDRAIVPAADERAGLFSSTLAVIRDPTSGQPFSGNQVPRSRVDSTAARMLELWPLPNFAGSTRENFIRNPPWNVTRDQVDARIDHNLTPNDKMFGRLSLLRFDSLRDSVFEQPARGGQNNDRAFDDNDARSVAYSYTRILTPTLLNEFRYGFSRQKVDKRELTKESLGDLASRFGIRGVSGNARLFGLPEFILGGSIGYTGLGEPASMPNFKIAQVHQFLNNLSWNRRNHDFKFGIDLRWNRSDIFGGSSSHGSFTFDGQFARVSFADFLLGLPASATLTSQVVGNFRFRNYMFYAQDDWKMTPRLTWNFGLRYELTTPWIEKHNNMNHLNIEPGPNFNTVVSAGYCGSSYSCRGLINLDTNNWAPRIGLAYQWMARTVLRSAFGVFYGSGPAVGGGGAGSRGIDNFPYNRRVTVNSTPTTPALLLNSGFPPDFLGGATPRDDSNWVVWQTNFPLPTVYQWNVAVQKEILPYLSLAVAYVGSASNYIPERYNWNGSPVGPLQTERQRRRIPQWNMIELQSPYGHASYHGLDVQLERRYDRGISFSSAYTWSHSIDNVPELFGPGGGGLQDFRNFSESRANSNFDSRHRFVAQMAYELPFGRSRKWASRARSLNQILGGWELSSLLSLQTGHYFTITVPNSRQRLGATGVGDWWPDRLGSGRLERRTADRWFDTSAFVLPRNPDGSFRLGNAGRAILNGDGDFNLDLGFLKTFAVRERIRLQFRCEAFNLTNTPTLDDPNTNLESPDFGKVRRTVSAPRQMQFALRIEF